MRINYQQVYQVLKHLVQLHLMPKMKSNCKLNYSYKNSKSNFFSINRDDDVIVPMGPSEPTPVKNSKGYTLNYNEYIVYDTKQVRMRYLIKLKFLFK